jgi:hypothetical protein
MNNNQEDWDLPYIEYLIGRLEVESTNIKTVIKNEPETSLKEIKTKNQELVDKLIDSLKKTNELMESFSAQIIYKKEIKQMEKEFG